MLSFTTPWILGAFAALALPLIAHLVERQRAQPRPFSSLRFITTTPLPRKGRRKLRDPLLLLLRMLFFAALILAFAGIQWQIPPAPDSPTGTHLILIDRSASMDGWERRNEARQAFAELLTQTARDNQAVGLLAFAHELEWLQRPSRDLSKLQELFDTHPPLPLEGKPALAIEKLAALSATGAVRRISLLSDFQEANWANLQWPGFPANVQLDLIHTPGDLSLPNASLLSARVVPEGEERIRIFGELRNDAAEDLTIPLTLNLDGQEQTRSFAVPAGQIRPFAFIQERPMEAEGLLSLPDDAFSGDNNLHFWAGDPAPIPVLIATPPPSMDRRSAADSEPFFLERALTASGGSLRIEPTRLSWSFIETALSPRTAAVFVPAQAARSASPTNWQRLRSFLEEGGTAFLSLDENAPQILNETGRAGLTKLRFLGFERSRRDLPQNPAQVILVADGPLAELFSGAAARDWSLLDLRCFAKLEESTNSPADLSAAPQPLLETPARHPLLLRLPHGKGALYLSTFPWDNQWSDLPLRNAFVPLVGEIAREASAGTASLLRLEVGDTPPSDLPELLGFSTASPGVHLRDQLPVEVNLPRREGLPDLIAPAQIVNQRLDQTAATRSPGSHPLDPAASSVIELWPYALLAALFLFLAESMLSRIPPSTAPATAKTP